jgi:hypothetical protein
MHIWRRLLQQSQKGEEEEEEEGGKDPIGGTTKADLFLNASELLRFNHIIFHKD